MGVSSRRQKVRAHAWPWPLVLGTQCSQTHLEPIRAWSLVRAAFPRNSHCLRSRIHRRHGTPPSHFSFWRLQPSHLERRTSVSLPGLRGRRGAALKSGSPSLSSLTYAQPKMRGPNIRSSSAFSLTLSHPPLACNGTGRLLLLLHGLGPSRSSRSGVR
jgi:hypothetical protein